MLQKSLFFGILQRPMQFFFIVFPAKYPNKPYSNSLSIFVSFFISILGFLFSSNLESENGAFPAIALASALSALSLLVIRSQLRIRLILLRCSSAKLTWVFGVGIGNISYGIQEKVGVIPIFS